MSATETTPEVGAVFGRLTVIARAPRGRQSRARWHVRCECGVEKVVRADSLRSGGAASCGCRAGHTTHGLRRHPLYRRWQNMLQRCQNPGNPRYADYGGRGITVCERWKGPEGFPNFVADMGECPEGRSLDRIDNDSGYEPGNCRWATLLEQRHNRRPRTHCLSGHEFTPENTRVNPTSGRRRCRICERAAYRRAVRNAEVSVPA